MLICGLKITHDGSVCLVRDGKLLFNIEIEKLDNNNRYSEILDALQIEKILRLQGYKCDDIDAFAVDGWGGYDQDSLAIQPRLRISKDHNYLTLKNWQKEYELPVSAYEERNVKDNVLNAQKFNGLLIGKKSYDYYSFLHVAGHVMSAYATSTFAQEQKDSYVFVWDGGMFPRLYFFDNKKSEIKNLGPLAFWVGNIYTIFSQHFGPFKNNLKYNFAKDDLSIAGKVMAYIACGDVKEELFLVFEDIYKSEYRYPMGFGNVLANKFKERIIQKNYKDEDILASFHKYLELQLINKLKKKIERYNFGCKNLCMAGGCALNIKWNSAIRNSKLFKEVYVPPFPNDSGSAIGAACCANLLFEGKSRIDWKVFSGPKIIKNKPDKGWISKECDVGDLAKTIFETGEPVVILHGASELGPRALGHRSILANPFPQKMKDRLNSIKKRESYRPVSPICLEKEAEKIFYPGSKDPNMLFDHKIRKAWLKKIPAVAHLDGTARLQTVDKDNKLIYELLHAYQKISGLPVLCNTSANLLGRGFFPDVLTATKRGKTKYVWCNNIIYIKE